MFKSINGGILPQRATKYSCGFDVFANEDVTIRAGETVLVGLGIAFDFDSIAQNIAFDRMINLEDWMYCHYFALHPRSSLRAKGLGGGVGIIDIDYRDEIKMVISNPISDLTTVTAQIQSETVRIKQQPVGVGGGFLGSFLIKKGDKIGQLILKRHEGYLMPSEYTKDEERVGGFGSSGDR